MLSQLYLLPGRGPAVAGGADKDPACRPLSAAAGALPQNKLLGALWD